MNIIQVVENLSPEMYLRLRHAAETGKWPEGNSVDEAQRASALQIVMAYQAKILNSDEMMTIGSDGNIVTKTKRELKAQFSPNQSQTPTSDTNSADTCTTQQTSPSTIARFSL